jgi:tetratricopeptide (TPR) repeat protein
MAAPPARVTSTLAPVLLCLLILSSHLVSSAHAQPPEDLRKTACVLTLLGMDQVRADTGLVYRSLPDVKLTFDLYKRPPSPRPKSGGPDLSRGLPVVIFVNGVGWFRSTPALKEWGIYKDWARLVAVHGMAAVLYDSRAANVREDLVALVEHLRGNAAKLGLDRDMIGIWACSANLRPGSAYALDPVNTWVKAGVFYYGNVDTTHVRPELPVLVARAGLDTPFTNASMSQYIQRAMARNANLTVLNLPNMRHAFDLVDSTEASRQAVRTTLEFLRRNLTPEMQEAWLTRSEDARAVRAHAARDWEAALAATKGWIQRDPENGHPHQLAGDASYQLKRYPDAALHYEAAGTRGWMPALAYYNAACSRALAGEREKAIEDLERAFATGFMQDRAAVLQDPDLATIRDDPRFQKLVAP